jgi:Protein of unknown function (DUF2442)
MARPARKQSDEEFDREYEAAVRLDGEYLRAGLYATGVLFDERARRFVLELTNGYSLGVPVASLPELATATLAELRQVALPTNDCMEFESLDVQYSVPGLVMALGARAIGRLGGKVTSPRKARASRANGKKGGRPRKTTGA